MYNVKIIITNQNSVKNTTAEKCSATQNFAILFTRLLNFVIFLQYFLILQNFLQYLKLFGILFAILEKFAIFLQYLNFLQ